MSAVQAYGRLPLGEDEVTLQPLFAICFNLFLRHAGVGSLHLSCAVSYQSQLVTLAHTGRSLPVRTGACRPLGWSLLGRLLRKGDC